MIVNKNSWHYKWLQFNNLMRYFNYGNTYDKIDSYFRYNDKIEDLENRWGFPEKPKTFCQYWREVLLSPLIFVLNLIILTFVLGTFITFLIYEPWNIVGVVAIILIGFALFTAVFFIPFGAKKLKEKLEEFKENPDGFASNLYKVYKDKVCTMMEYKND